MKKLKYLVLTMLTLIAASCGGPKDATKELEVSSAEVLGDSADIVSVVDGTYTLAGTVPTDITQTLTIKLKIRLEKSVEDNGFEIVGWKVALLDENGTSLLDDLTLKDEETSKMKKFLTNGKVGDEKEFTFSQNIANGDLFKKIMDKTSNISLNGVDLYVPHIYSSDSESSEDSSSDINETDEITDVSEASSGDNNWDELLDSYEEFVDQYIKLLKKAQKGDMSAATEYMEYMQKAQNLSEKFSEAQGEMTVEQWARYTKILTKMTKAAQ